jgi:ATP-binding cassette subfamily B protein
VETVDGNSLGQSPRCREGGPAIRWEGLFARFIRTGFKASTTQNIISNIADFLTNLSYLLILWFGAPSSDQAGTDDRATGGFPNALQPYDGPLLRLVQLWQNLQQVLLSVDRIGDILNTEPEAEAGSGSGAATTYVAKSALISFLPLPYQPEPVLRGISFSVEPGMLGVWLGGAGRARVPYPSCSNGCIPVNLAAF